MKTREFNLQNWTGETAIVSYSVKNRSFEFQGERFYLGGFAHYDGGQTAAVHLYGESWEGPITTLFVDTDFKTPTMMHAAIIAAVRYAANHI